MGALSGVFVLLISVAVATAPYWTQLTATGDIPRPLWDGSSAFDKTTNQWYIFGGLNGTYPVDFQVADFSVLSVSTLKWTSLSSANGPSPRAECPMWVDPQSHNVFVSGGRGRFRTGTDLTYDDTFVFNHVSQTWNLVPQTAAQRQIANRSTGAVVANNKRPYVFSGSSSTLPGFINRPGGLRTNVVSFKLKGWGGWKNITTGTEIPTPTPRAHHPLGYSPSRNSLYTYGGYTSDPNGGTFTEANYLGDLWRFDLGTEVWTQINFDVTQSPGKRDDSLMVVDEVRNGFWLFGGGDWTNAIFSDLWYFDLNTNIWTLVPTQTVPPATIGAFHFSRKVQSGYELFVYGGSLGEFGGGVSSELWKLTIPC